MRRLALAPELAQGKCVFNMGGPERLSRVDIAAAVAQHLKCSDVSIVSVPVSSVVLSVPSPVDISMDSAMLYSCLCMSPTRLVEALKQIFPE